MFVDASALVTIAGRESEREGFIDAILRDGDPLWSPMSCWETVLSLRRSYAMTVEAARREVDLLANTLALRLVGINERELTTALDAYQTYGKGRHPAGLNMGDCFAYACAKTNGAALLYKGDDFALTDLA